MTRTAKANVRHETPDFAIENPAGMVDNNTVADEHKPQPGDSLPHLPVNPYDGEQPRRGVSRVVREAPVGRDGESPATPKNRPRNAHEKADAGDGRPGAAEDNTYTTKRTDW